HDAGVAATPQRAGRFAAAVAAARPAGREALYWLARVTLVGDRSELATFDRVVAEVLGAPPPSSPGGEPLAPSAPPVALAVPTEGRGPDGDDAGEDDGVDGAERLRAAASVEERLRHTDFDEWTEAERERLRTLVGGLPVVAPSRPGRRHRPARHGHRDDVRATLRRAHRTGGDPVVRARRRRTVRPRRLVLLADVSGSMEAYSRAYLWLLHRAVRGARAEAFVFATRLSRLTVPLREADPDAALAQAAALAPDWSGGTRIGEALRRFNEDHGRRGLARGAVVVVVSDGWERADPTRLGEEMARLARLAHRVVWVNPRAATEGFAPLAGGMAAALPHVDALVSGHSPAAMAELLAVVAADGPGGRGSHRAAP
ncbi:MAG: VWA domain-containing protein, partial [Acidimicrobiales bacterium]|nr:VWA domain-containing protein [Acidimicrobiales bacterium]